MRRQLLYAALTSICIIFLSAQPVAAQNKGSNIFDKLKSLFEDDALSFGALLQPQAEVHWDPNAPGENTFRMANARFKLYGDLGDSFSYAFQTNFAGGARLLDANLSYYDDYIKLTAGAQKPGLSGEFLTPAPNTDFIDRSRIVEVLAQRRDVGLKARIAFSPAVHVTGGIFNGENQNMENSNNTFYYTGRLEITPDIGDGNSFKIGLNAAKSIENGTRIGNGTLPLIEGERTVYGGDIRLKNDRFLLSSELLYGELEYTLGREDDVMGFHATGGYDITNQSTLLLRYDYLESDVVQLPEEMLIAGYSHNFSDMLNFQLNYRIDLDEADFDNHSWLAMIQFAF